MFHPNHVLHLLLTLVTCGFWLLVWAMAGMNASAVTAQNRKRYDAEMERYVQEYDTWQRRYIQAYGVAPPPMG